MIASSGLGFKLWHTENLELYKDYSFMSKNKQIAQITSFHFKHDNSQMACVVDTDYIKIYDFDQRTSFDLMEATDAKCCSYDSTGRYLAVGTTRGSLDMFDFKSSSFKKRNLKNLPSTIVNCLCYSKNDRYLATGNSDGTICLYNMNTCSFNKPLIHQNHAKSICPPHVTSIHYLPLNIGSLGASYQDGSAILWDVSKEQPYCVFKEHNSFCTSIVSSPINAILFLSGSLDNNFNMYDTTTKKLIKTVNCSGGITCLDILKNGITLNVGTSNGNLLMYDLRATENGPYLSIKAHDSSVFCTKFIQSTSREKLTVINSNLQAPVNNDYSMKRSNSYNNEMIQPKINYGIYSPEPSHTNNSTAINNNNTNESTGQNIIFQNNQVNHLNSGESFILHRKNTSNTNLHSVSNNNFNNQNEISSPTMPGSNNIHELTSNVSSRRPDLKVKQIKSSKLTNDILSPISSTSVNHHFIKAEQGGGGGGGGSILSSTAAVAAASINGLDSTKLSSTHVISNIQVNEPSFKYSPKKNQESQSPKQQQQQNDQMITLSTDQLKELLKDAAKEALKEYNNEKQNNQQFVSSSSSSSSSMSVDQIKIYIREIVEEFHDDMMSENFKSKIEMFKEFTQLEENISKKIESYSLNVDLLEEIAKLKEENKRLKSQF